MRKIYLLSTLVLIALFGTNSYAQDFSNKGNEFWLCFPNHIPSGNNLGHLSIWITSDQASSGTVTMTNGAFTSNFTVAANGITEIEVPYANAHISNAESGSVIQKSIKVAVNPGQPPIVAYAQQWGAARSAATLLLPTSVLGKKYRAMSFTHTATSGLGQNSRSHLQIIATEPNTVVTVTPYANGAAGTPFTINFPNKGDMYQYQAQQDVTGTLIESIASGSGSCMPIAVFSGNSSVTIGTTTCTNPNSFDPLFQQCYPITSWGKNFGFIPFGDYTNGNPYRVMASEDNTKVFFNGIQVTTLNAGQIYPAAFTSTPVVLTQPTSITADKPIAVAQYAQTSACSGTNNGDPDMVLLNPIEQNIKDITVFASTQQNINRQWINILIPTAAAASFRIDGFPPPFPFTPAPNIPGYSYLQHQFVPAAQGSHLLTADSGFNAICYGFQQGNFESYAYSAGANVKDLTQQLELGTQYGIESSPSICINTPFQFKLYFPDSTTTIPGIAVRFDSLKWEMTNHCNLTPYGFPIVQKPPTIDSTNFRNGRQVNWYSLPGFYSFGTPGRDTLILTAYKSTNEGCGSEQVYKFPIEVSGPPIASFSITPGGCPAEAFEFEETTPQSPKPTYLYWWSFGDPASGLNNNATTSNPSHLFTGPGTYTVRFMDITTPGCLSDTVEQSVVVPDFPTATIAGGTTFCINDPVAHQVTFTGADGDPEYQFSYTIDNGSGPGPVQTVNSTAGVATVTIPNNVAGTFRYQLTEVRNLGSTLCVRNITGQFVDVVIQEDATIVLNPTGTNNQTVCVNHPITNIKYDIAGSGTGANITWLPGPPAGLTSTFAAGSFTISGTPTSPGNYSYTVESEGPCVKPSLTGTLTVTDESTLTYNATSGPKNQEVCKNSSIVEINFTPTGSATGGTVVFTPALPGVTGTFTGGLIRIQGTPTLAGTFTYTVTPTGPCVEATGTDGGTIIVNELPTPNFSVTNPSCETRELTFTDLSVPNSGVLTNWEWTFGDGPTIYNGQNQTHTYATAGTYTVTLKVTTDKGCVSAPILSRQITVNSRPEADFTVPEVCINDVATVFPDVSTGGPFDAAGYFWNFGDPASGINNTSTTQNGSHLFTAVGNYTVMHVVTTLAGCKDTTYHDIFINAADPVSDFTINNLATLCSNDSVALVNRSTVSAGNVTKLDIYWDNVGAPGTFETINVPVFNAVYKHKYPTLTTTQNYTIRLVAYSGTICLSNRTQTITVNATPRVQFNAMPDACLDAAPFQITQATETGGVAGTGVFSGPGVTPGGIFNPASVGPGTYMIKYTYTSSAAGCVDTLSMPIRVRDSASAQFTYSALACEKTAVDFSSISSTIPAGEGTITGWNWNFGDPASGANNTSTAANPSHLFTGWGTYNVTLFVTTSNGCRSTVRTIPVYVNPIPRPNFTIPVSACLPSANVTFTNTSTIPDGTQATFSYLWNFDDPPSGINNTSTGTSPSHIYNTVGPFNVNLEVTSGAGCVHDTTIVLNTIHPEPVGAFAVNKPDVCIGQSFTFTDNSDPADGTITAWTWDMGNSDTRTVSTFNYTYPAAGQFTVKLYITNSHGCRSSTATRVVTVNPYPIVNAGPDLFILQGGSDTLEPIVTAINPTFLWTPNTYFLSSNTIKNAIVQGVEDITYLLTVTGQGDCVSTDEVFIKVLKGPEIPNIFSPNGDGIHDRWEIKYLDTYPGGTVEIFNRYGQLIFKSTGYGTPWDGKVNGKDVPVGTYYYIVNPKNGRSIMSGYVDVIR
jgi:gliding motility-associated-like protein